MSAVTTHACPECAAVQSEADELAAELSAARKDRDSWRSAHDSAAGVIRILEKSREDVRAELADANRHAEALRHALRAMILARPDLTSEAEHAAASAAYRALSGVLA